MPGVSVVLIESDAKTRNSIEGILKSLDRHIGILAATAHLHEGMKIMQNNNPDVVILEVKDVESGAKEVALISSRYPHIAVFVTTVEKNPDWILKLIRAGASEYLTKPIIAAELAEAISKVERQLTKAKGETARDGHAITVYNPCGGMGTTTIAVNLAASLAAQGKKTAVLDLNSLSGDVTAFLDLNPRYTLADVTANAERLDTSFLMSVMAGHRSEIDILSGPKDVEDWTRITPEQIQEVIRLMKTVYEHVVIDAGGPLGGCNLAAFTGSDHILFPTVLSLPAIKNARRYLPLVSSYGFAGRVKLIVNRHTPKDDIRVSDAEKILSTKAFKMIPNGYSEVMGSINKGMPLNAIYPKSPVTKAVGELARLLSLDVSSHKITSQRTSFYDAIPAVQFGSTAIR